MVNTITIRKALLSDLSEIQTLFVGTIRQVAKQDYSPAQLEAWAGGVHNQQRWQDAIQHQYFLLAIFENAIVGFGSLTNDGYLDFLFVHKHHQRKGIANLLYQRLEQQAIQQNSSQLTTNASITARPFFLAQGFEEVKENRNQIGGVEIINNQMKKVL